jgi:type VI secretion system protein ImpM
MARPLLQRLDLWIQDGILAMQRIHGAQWLAHYLVAPLWSFVIPAGMWAELGLVGVLIPSVDKVGRYFPFVLVHPLPEAARLADSLPPASQWLPSVGRTLIQALVKGLDVDQIVVSLEAVSLIAGAGGDVFSVLGEEGAVERFVWPELPQLFEARSDRSFWWAVPAPDRPPRLLIDRGEPGENLFCDLFGPPD